ncbi:MAG: lipid-A-disaccharide synthase, partial [Pseudomonadota bacterium]|nr:lipid-A-disaccharide synthase [Pseudomonadota bacterium]
MKKIKFVFSVGEESGDFLGAQLIKNLKKKYPEASFVGLAGKLMQKEGMESLFPIEDLSVMGLIDPLLNLKRLLRRRRQLIDFILKEQPEFFIGIDSPSFNAGIAKRIKPKTNTKTIQYVCPQFWAWRKGRARRFKNYLDHIYSIFPFEEKLLANEDMPSNFTGHPLAEHFEIDLDKREFKSKMSLNSKKIYIALLPGSRKSELKNHLKILEKVASSYFSSNPNYHFIVALTEENPISENK